MKTLYSKFRNDRGSYQKVNINNFFILVGVDASEKTVMVGSKVNGMFQKDMLSVSIIRLKNVYVL